MIHLKTLNATKGFTDVYVEPDCCISSLRKYEGNDCVFLFKFTVLVESFTFNFYNIRDGDIICAISRYHADTIKYSLDKNPRAYDIELEHLKIIDQRYRRIEGSQSCCRKFQDFRLKLDANYVDEYGEDIHVRVPKPLNYPSKSPLPIFWKNSK